ncbi:RNA polymerase III subunit [Cavenderia fasciculata]|uniref:RNA polymerase III subunit n=1 Tax=Cavenderia fasciculata TaxID=261658 RepID=F4PWT3_CACFS|nr:RNA polymerase III subunit [Cavenderia fasciculata]EGG20447.1 RNA polymerase III subunit [Cavenderia fasciculata]|eukprot:XP_004367430.1 RNA polymerase III subunit [Cavenderia fasciculata]
MSTKENNSVVLKSKKKPESTTTTTDIEMGNEQPTSTSTSTTTTSTTSTTTTTDSNGDVPMIEEDTTTENTTNSSNGDGSTSTSTTNGDGTTTTTTTDTNGTEKTTTGTNSSILDSASRMDLDDGEDYVVQEVPVYLNQQLSDNLFLFQYPLRQPWRPYDMTQLDSIRIKPRQQRVEMDFNMDLTNENYNENADVKTEKYTLGSTTVSHRANYAVGIFRNDEFHITPLQSIIQLRPSFGTVDNMWESEKEAKKKEKQDMGIEDEEEDGEQQPTSYRKPNAAKTAAAQPTNQLKKMEDEEEWINLELVGDKNDEDTIKHIDKLVCQKREKIKLDLNEHQYVDILCPRTVETWVPKAIHNKEIVSLEAIHQMDWKAQVKQILLNGHIIAFSKLFQLLKLPLGQNIMEYDVAEEVQSLAHLIRGRWVVKSEHDFFEVDCVNRQEFGDKVFLTNDQARDIVSKIATLDTVNRTWHLKGEPDDDFLYKYNNIVEVNRKYFVDSKNEIMKKVKDLSDPSKNSFLGALLPKEFMQKAGPTKPNQVQNIVPEDYKEGKTLEQQLLFFLYHLFKTHGVITKQFIIQQIIKQGQEEEEGCLLKDVQDEIINETIPKIANTMHNTMYLKQLGQPNIDKFRNCILEAFQKKMILKKAEITAICMKKLNEDCPGSTLSVIMRELAHSKGTSTWIFKKPN